MIRRSRISVRPNVRPTGRAQAVTFRDASDKDNNSDPGQAPGDPDNNEEVKAREDEVKSSSSQASEKNIMAGTQSDETVTQAGDIGPAGDEGTQNIANTVSTNSTRRRMRFSVLPNFSQPRTTSAPAHTRTAAALASTQNNPAPTQNVLCRSPTKTAPTTSPSRTMQAPVRTSSRTPKSPVKAMSSPELPSPPPVLTSAQPAVSNVKANHSARDPGRRRKPSGGGRQPRAQPGPSVPSQTNVETPASSVGRTHSKLEETRSANQNARTSSSSGEIQLEPLPVNKIPPEIPESQPSQSEKECVVQEVNKVSPEKSECSAQNGKSQSVSTAHIPSALKTLNDPVDRLRLAKAKKLRELLKREMGKHKKDKHSKMGLKERKATAKDHTKMTMRDLIYYLPSTNPMKSYMEDEQRVTETLLASPKPVPAPASAETVEEALEEEEETAGSNAGEEQPLLAPRVKVAEDGSLIIDEESLTVEVLRVKGPNPAEERDPIFEQGSSTTYSSFRKGTYTKPWSNRETDMFFLAISMVGTDFSMIGQLFPHRARIEIKNKFKKEERANSWRIDKAFRERRRLDLDFFTSLLERILKDEESKSKKKKDAAKAEKVPEIPRGTKRSVGKKKAQSSGSEEEEEEEEESVDSDMLEGEKENEGVCTDGCSTTSPIRTKKMRTGSSPKKSRQTDTADEGPGPEDTENCAADSPVKWQPKSDSALTLKNQSSPIKPARLKDQTQTALHNTGQGRRSRSLQKRVQDTSSSAGEESQTEGASKVSPSSAGEKESPAAEVMICGLEDSAEEEEPDLTAIQEHILNKPTRSGRIPKLSKHMIRAVAEEEEEEELPLSVPPPLESQPRGTQGSCRRARAKPGPNLKRGLPRRGKSKLVTIRASGNEEDEDEEEYDMSQEEEHYHTNVDEENQAFVPVGLRTQQQVDTEVEETMEELDISVNVPDVLGISQNALCSESSCDRAPAPAGTVPCEHQLDLLVDVIEFLAPEHMEVSEESYAEAARTLLTIGNSAHRVQSAEPISTGDDIIVEESSRLVPQVHQEVVLETTEHSEATAEACQTASEPFDSITSDCAVSFDVCDVGPDNVIVSEPPSQQDSILVMEGPISTPNTDIQPDSTQSEGSVIVVPETSASQMRRNRLPKPKPNLGRAFRPARAQQNQTTPEPASGSLKSATTYSRPMCTQQDQTAPEPASGSLECTTTASRPMQAQQQDQSAPEPTSGSLEGTTTPYPTSSLEAKIKVPELELDQSVEIKRNLNETSSVESPTVTSRPELRDKNSEVPDPRASGEEGDSHTVPGHTKTPQDGGSEDHVVVNKERVQGLDERLQTQQTQSSESPGGSSVPESSAKPAQSTRRCRGPKPRPNLVGTLRTARSQQIPSEPTAESSDKQAAERLPTNTFTDSQRPEDGDVTGPNTSPNKMQQVRETNVCELLHPHHKLEGSAIPDASPAEVFAAVSKPTTAERIGVVTERGDEDISAEQSGSTVEVMSTDLPIDPDCPSDEPVFILSLTEVPPSLVVGTECAEPPPSSPKSKFPSEPLSITDSSEGGPGSAGGQVSHILLPDALMPVMEEQEKKAEGVRRLKSREKEKDGKEVADSGQMKRGRDIQTATSTVEGTTDQPVELSSEAEGSLEEMDSPAKRRKLPEKGRRAKLKVRPNPVQRQKLPSVHNKELPAASSTDQSCPTSFASQETVSVSKDTAPHNVSSQESSSALVSRGETSSTGSLDQRTKDLSVTPKDPAPVPVFISLETLETGSVSETSAAQGIVGQVDLSEREEDTETNGSGVKSQPIHQITPLATSGPLSRPGRRPKGFLSFMSNTSTQSSSATTRRPTAGPTISTSRSERKRPMPGSSALPGKLVSTSRSTQVTPSPPSTQMPASASTPALEVSASPSEVHPETSCPNPSVEEEPTSVSAYFFSDIFTMVDELEETD